MKEYYVSYKFREEYYWDIYRFLEGELQISKVLDFLHRKHLKNIKYVDPKPNYKDIIILYIERY